MADDFLLHIVHSLGNKNHKRQILFLDLVFPLYTSWSTYCWSTSHISPEKWFPQGVSSPIFSPPPF